MIGKTITHYRILEKLSEGEICFFAKPDENGRSDLSICEFATGKIRKILTIERPGPSDPIAVSPDGRTILYSQDDESGSDLMLVENFK
jgi:Tol biopolymer transport system component